jgi:hypothetical protein
MMKVDFQTWITFEILWGNGIFASLRIMEPRLKVLKLNFCLGNADFDRGTLWKSNYDEFLRNTIFYRHLNLRF